MMGSIYILGMNHKTAPVEIREQFSLAGPRFSATPPVPLSPCLTETAVLSTCNRVEILAVGKNEAAPDEMLRSWAAAVGHPAQSLLPHIYARTGREAVLHLFHVASSLDSMILGEPQILGQLKEAYRQAVAQKTSRFILTHLFHKAFTAAKRVRTETGIAANAVSASSAAAELARRIFDDIRTRTVLLIGAGEMAELAAAHISRSGIGQILVANRTFERARELAAHFGGIPLPLEELSAHLPEADIILSSTGSPETVLSFDQVRAALRARRNRPIFIVDIAVPRDVDPAVNTLDNVYLYNIDDLEKIICENGAERCQEAKKAMGILEKECDAFFAWADALSLAPAITALSRQGEAYAREEVKKTLKKLKTDDPEITTALEKMAAAIVKKMNRAPIAFLRDQQDTSSEEMTKRLHYVRSVFKLDTPDSF